MISWDEAVATTAPTTEADTDSDSSWLPVDMVEALKGDGPPPATLLKRTDGVPLIYPGRVHWFQGESESLKSWLAVLAAVQALAEGLNVVWVDYEDDPMGVGARMVALGAPRDVITDPTRFAYIQPTDGLQDHRSGTFLPGSVDLWRVLTGNEWHLVVIDGVTEAMTVEGLSLLDNADIAAWLRVLPKYIVRKTGAAVIAIDHVTKSKESQGRFAIGGQHKLAGTTGATYKIEALTNLSRAISEPITGQSLITIQKDRPGWVRPHQRGDDKRIGILEITSYPDGGVSGIVLPPDQATITPPWALIERILNYINTYDGASKTNIEEATEGRVATTRAALGWLVEQGHVAVTKSGQSHRHSLTIEGQKMLSGGR
jgi:hypothetical protein